MGKSFGFLDHKRMIIKAIRGATTCLDNTKISIKKAVQELVAEVVSRNDLDPSQIISVIFSVTKDLDACFPASIARQQKGWEKVALLDCQQMLVHDDLSFCIRILVHVYLPERQEPQHTYLGKASMLRPDR